MNAPRARPVHAPMRGFSTADNCLLVGGCTVTDLASRVGQTPFYAYDRRLLTSRVAELRAALPDAVHLHFAMKANPMPALVQHMAGLVDGLDVASAGELQVALDAGVDPAVISFAGPGKKPDELAAAAAAGIVVNLESPTEMRRLADIAHARNCVPRVAVRVNPDFELKTSGMKMGGGPQQFGIDAEQVPGILAEMARLPLEFVGFHIFSGSQNLSAAAIAETQSRTIDLAISLAEHAPSDVRLLNIGGGFGIPYFPGETPLDLGPVGDNLTTLLPRVQEHMPQAEVVIELGRYLVGEAGVYVCRVVDRKVSRGRVFLITDGGLHHHLAASGNFGQIIRKNYPVCVGNRVAGEEREEVSVVGPLCTPLDLLADRMELPKADIDDLIIVLQSGAYGYTASPHRFLSHPAPKEILVG